MRVPDDVICKVCQSVFCCAECRHKHEIKNHAIVVRRPIMCSKTTTSDQKQTNENDKALQVASSFETIYLFCPICEKRPLPLKPELHSEMLIHIECHHLPLRCEKCSKMYNKIDDLKEFSKCMRPTLLCQSQESLTTNQSCYTDEASKVTVTKAMIPLQHTSPRRNQEFNESHLTPISIINMRWKAKSKLTHEEFISDSVSSIKNLSSISNSSVRRSIGVASAVKGKVIRCSSTPVHLEMVFAKPKEQTFNASGGSHISSIQYSSGCESDNSPAFQQANSQALEPMNRYLKVCGTRPKISAVTPLRQVMSKSIQKAFAAHGLPASTALRSSTGIHQRKQMFDTTSSPDLNANGAQSPVEPALDLRLSPAVRRSQSESGEYLQQQVQAANQHVQHNELPNLRRKIMLSAQKLTTESIVITRTEHLASVSSSSSTSVTSSNGSINSLRPYTTTNSSYQSANSTGGSVFKTCSSVEIITATTEQIKLQTENVTTHATVTPLTPITRIPGAVINKKIIQFETPRHDLPEPHENQNSPVDVFFTPNATPMRESDSCETLSAKNNQRKNSVKQNLSGRFSPHRRPSIRECAHSTAFSRIENITHAFDDNVDDDALDDEVFLTEDAKENSEENLAYTRNKGQPQQQSGGLWSLMTSVMKMPSRKDSVSKDSTNIMVGANSNSILKRCASIAGSLVRSKPLINETELSSLKRKRTYTIDHQSTSAYISQLNNSDSVSPTESLNTSSKRFRIQGRRPIDRMRLNS